MGKREHVRSGRKAPGGCCQPGGHSVGCGRVRSKTRIPRTGRIRTGGFWRTARQRGVQSICSAPLDAYNAEAWAPRSTGQTSGAVSARSFLAGSPGVPQRSRGIRTGASCCGDVHVVLGCISVTCETGRGTQDRAKPSPKVTSQRRVGSGSGTGRELSLLGAAGRSFWPAHLGVTGGEVKNNDGNRRRGQVKKSRFLASLCSDFSQ